MDVFARPSFPSKTPEGRGIVVLPESVTLLVDCMMPTDDAANAFVQPFHRTAATAY